MQFILRQSVERFINIHQGTVTTSKEKIRNIRGEIKGD